MKKEVWIPDFKKHWYKIEIESYKLIYKEAKERMEEVLSESESITNKSIRFIIALVAVSGYFFNIFVKAHISSICMCLLFILLLIPLILFCFLVFPKNVKMRGFMPKEFIPKEIHSDNDKDYQEHILYYNAIVNLQNDIDHMNNKNKLRTNIYISGLILSILMFVVFVLFTALSSHCTRC